jgi:hypothetical protein
MKRMLAALLVAGSATTAIAQNIDMPADGSPRTTTTLYIVPGVINDPSVGLATAFICNNAGSGTASVSVTVRNGSGSISGQRSYTIPSLDTVTVSTKFTNLFFESAELGSGLVRQGRAVILGNSRNVHCTAHVVNTTSTLPNTIDLHMVRYNPASGTTE